MRTPRLSLRIFALTMLLPLLLLACGVSDEPASEAPSERATAEPTSPETDREALVVLYNATDGPNWEDNESWLSDAPLGEWEGVTIDSNGRVTELDLTENQLSGEIPPELGNLVSLTLLLLGFNELSGEIPPELGNLVSLEVLDLSLNELSGEIPLELGNLVSLTLLGLGNNELSGEIPPDLGNLVSLTGLFLQKNELSGEIPPELGNLVSLEVLYLVGNQLSGCVPASLSSTDLDLSVPNCVDRYYCP